MCSSSGLRFGWLCNCRTVFSITNDQPVKQSAPEGAPKKRILTKNMMNEIVDLTNDVERVVYALEVSGNPKAQRRPGLDEVSS